MKKMVLFLGLVVLSSFGSFNNSALENVSTKEVVLESSFSLINDSKDKITIHTGTGVVSLNKGSKTSIGCNVGKKVCWAEKGIKKDVIFEITAEMCGKTLKLSELMK